MKALVWKTLLKYGLGFGLLAYVIIANWEARDGRPGIGDILRRPIHVGPLLLAALIAAVGLLITFVRWYMLVRAVGLPFRLYNAIRLGLVGYYFNTFLPGSVGGDILKAYAISREQSRRTVAISTVLIDRVIGLWALVWFVAIIGSVFWILDDPLLKNPELMTIVRYSIIVVGITMAIWFLTGLLSEDRAERFALLLSRTPKIGGSLAEFWRACWMYRKQPRAVLIAVLMSLVGHTGWVLVFHFSVLAFETPNPAIDVGSIPEHMIVVPVGMTFQAIFPTPGGVGGGEAAYGWLYTLLDKPKINGIVGCLSQRVIFWGLGILGYIVYTRMRAGIERIEARAVAEQEHPPPEPEKPAVDAAR